MLTNIPNNTAVALAFIKAINDKDIQAMEELLDERNHVMMLKTSICSGIDETLNYWTTLFENIPQYRIEITHTLEQENSVILFGDANETATLKNPVGWEASIFGGYIVSLKKYREKELPTIQKLFA